MKLLILSLVLASCGYTRYAPPTDKKVTVEYILKYEDGSGEVWAVWKSKTRATAKLYYMATFDQIPDSLIKGKTFVLKYGTAPDSCKCTTFKIVK